MALKSYRLTFKKGKKKKRRGVRDLVVGGVGAIIGISFVSQTAGVIKSL